MMMTSIYLQLWKDTRDKTHLAVVTDSRHFNEFWMDLTPSWSFPAARQAGHLSMICQWCHRWRRGSLLQEPPFSGDTLKSIVVSGLRNGFVLVDMIVFMSGWSCRINSCWIKTAYSACFVSKNGIRKILQEVKLMWLLTFIFLCLERLSLPPSGSSVCFVSGIMIQLPLLSAALSCGLISLCGKLINLMSFCD